MKTLRLINYRIIIIVFILTLVNSLYAQWPQWRGSLRDGICNEKNLLKSWPLEGPKLTWSVDKLGDGFSSAAITDELVFTTGKRDSVEILTAIDINGNLKWQKPFGRASKDKDWPQSRSTPTVYKNKVYTITVCGDIACFDCISGNIDWQMAAFEKFEGKSFGSPLGEVAESPLVVDDKLIFTPCGEKTTMVALNRLTGETIWQSESIHDTTSFTSPVLITIDDKVAIFNSTKNYDLLVDCNTGGIIWKDKHNSGMVPQVIKNQIYFTGEYYHGGALCSWNKELNKLTIDWKDTIKANSIGGAGFFDDRIIVSGNSKGIFCLDPTTGKIVSQFDRINYSTFLVADSMLFCYEDKTGRLALLKMNGNNLELVSSFKITLGNGPRIAHLALSDGLLFVRRGEVLMAFDVKQH
jgi:outer membrane protein assembly factor BamB